MHAEAGGSLPTFTTPVSALYDGYREIMASKRRGDTTLAEQLHERFGITAWEWSRLKIVYEAADSGDVFAEDLIAKVEKDRLTVSEAYGLLQRRVKDHAAAVDLPKTVSLSTLYQTAIRTAAYAETTAKALRVGIPVSTRGMTSEEVADCVRQTRAASIALRQIADALSRSNFER